MSAPVGEADGGGLPNAEDDAASSGRQGGRSGVVIDTAGLGDGVGTAGVAADEAFLGSGGKCNRRSLQAPSQEAHPSCP
jgi:hypothetical protein